MYTGRSQLKNINYALLKSSLFRIFFASAQSDHSVYVKKVTLLHKLLLLHSEIGLIVVKTTRERLKLSKNVPTLCGKSTSWLKQTNKERLL